MKLNCEYRLLVDPDSPDRYGIAVSLNGEQTVVEHIVGSQALILSLLQSMERGCVTPVSVRDIIDDFLLSI